MDRITQSKKSRDGALDGQCVSFTGSFAALTRREIVALVERHGGQYEPRVTRKTTMLVVGLSGFPLLPDGSMSRKLVRARALAKNGQPLEIVREDDWYDRLELRESKASICGTCRLDQIPGLTGVSARRVQSWIRAGLIRPIVADEEAVPKFDYRQIASLKKLNDLSSTGVTTEKLRRSLERLSTWFPEAHDILPRLDLLNGKHLVVRDDDDSLIDVGRQRLWDFDSTEIPSDEPVAAAYAPRPQDADALFDEAVSLEAEERFEEAETVYRHWLSQFGADADVSFNLANVLRAMGQDEAALERYRLCVEMRPTYSEAWLNLGDFLAELKMLDEALAATRRALELEPTRAESIYNLATILDELGRTEEARRHWETFLRLESAGECADYARARLSHAS